MVHVVTVNGGIWAILYSVMGPENGIITDFVLCGMALVCFVMSVHACRVSVIMMAIGIVSGVPSGPFSD